MIWRRLHFCERYIKVLRKSIKIWATDNEGIHEWDLADQSNGAAQAMLTSIRFIFGSVFEFIVDKYPQCKGAPLP